MRQAVRGLAAFMLYCDSEINTRRRRIQLRDLVTHLQTWSRHYKLTLCRD